MARRIDEWPIEERPRERLLEVGPSALGDSELLALVLGTGVRGRSALELARNLLVEAGGTAGLARMSVAGLSRMAGLGVARAAAVVAALELGRRLAETRLANGASFRTSGDVFAHFRARMGALRKEIFCVVLLDAKHRKLRDVKISEGSLTSSIVHPREVFEPAVRESAAAIVLVHNHPSGDPAPSAEDVEITRRLREVGEILGIRVLDHVIVGADRHFSFVDSGYW